MPSYSLTNRLPSCKVSKKTIEELEDYMVKTLKDHKTDPGSNILTRLTIKDSSGKEILNSIKDFDRNVFPNDIRGIELQVDDSNFPALSIGTQFHINKLFTEMTVSFRGNASREVVKGIANEIIHRVEPYRTNHHILHNGLVGLLVFGFAFLGMWSMLNWNEIDEGNRKFFFTLFVVSLFMTSSRKTLPE